MTHDLHGYLGPIFDLQHKNIVTKVILQTQATCPKSRPPRIGRRVHHTIGGECRFL